MWIYEQKTGALYNSRDVRSKFYGYAGHGAGLNNPDMQNVHATGPLPQGFYTIEQPMEGGHLGVFHMFLRPYTSNQMFRRSEFYLHGDNPAVNHTASDGCMVFSNPIRHTVWNSGDRILQVVSGLPPKSATVAAVSAQQGTGTVSTLSKFYHAHSSLFSLLGSILEDAASAAIPGPAGAAITKAISDVKVAASSLSAAATQIPTDHTISAGSIVQNVGSEVLQEAISIGMAAIAKRNAGG